MRTASDKIQDALELLNEAAKDKKDELYGKIEEQYSQVKELLAEKVGDGEEIVHHAKKQLSKTVQSKPWQALGAAALGAFIFGIVMGRK